MLDEIAAHLSHRSAGEHGVIVTPDGKPVDAARWGYYFRQPGLLDQAGADGPRPRVSQDHP